jgi:hypothetical protein
MARPQRGRRPRDPLRAVWRALPGELWMPSARKRRELRQRLRTPGRGRGARRQLRIQQPVLGYALAAPFVALWPGATASPFVALLAYRAFSCWRSWPASGSVCALPPGRHLDWGLLVLLLPGTTRGLVRASNDAASFPLHRAPRRGLQERGARLWAAAGVATSSGSARARACAELWSRNCGVGGATLVAVLAAFGASRPAGWAPTYTAARSSTRTGGDRVGLAKSGYGVVNRHLARRLDGLPSGSAASRS